MRAMKQIWSYAGLGTSIRFCVSQRDGEGTRIDIDLATAFFSQSSEFKEQAVADFLAAGLELTNREPTTPISFALQLSPKTFGVFDAFASVEDRQAHLAGNMAKALMSRVDEMLANPPSVEPVDTLEMKNQPA